MSDLSETAQTIFLKKYAKQLKSGNYEEWEQCAARVGTYVARAEEREVDYLEYSADFTKIIADRVFIPGGRVLANAGTGIRNLMNCFSMPLDDTRQSIYNTLKNAAEIFAWGGGVGYNASHLREKGAPVKTTSGLASGPVSFLELFDTTGEVISQASRRGAQLAILSCDHPDIKSFITHKHTLNEKNKRIYDEFCSMCKDKKAQEIVKRVLAENQLTHFNISVGISNSFMDAVTQNAGWNLISRAGRPTQTISATELFDLIAKNAWTNGDPGLLFLDTVEEFNLVPYLGKLEGLNPCSEVPLLPNEACCLGSINLASFVEDTYIDYQYLKDVVRYAVRFLDNVQTISTTPVVEINKATKLTRRLGLGVMGFADLLAEMNIPYNHAEALDVAENIAKFIQKTAWEYSMQLADEKGAFPAFDAEKINWKLIDGLNLPHKPLRNVAVTALAPTGTISLIGDVNSSIEPFFAKKYTRNVTSGIGNVAETSLDSDIKYNNILTAHDIDWKDHINMQAMWQKYIDGAVSKTINMHEDVTVDDVKNAYFYAWEKGCKGTTIYRDRSRNFQILNTT